MCGETVHLPPASPLLRTGHSKGPGARGSLTLTDWPKPRVFVAWPAEERQILLPERSPNRAQAFREECCMWPVGGKNL